MGLSRWKQYDSKNFGRHNFQIGLAIDLMNYGIGLKWDGKSENTPSFMPKGSLVPCDCGKGFFCVNGLTNGIPHRRSKKARVTVEYECGIRVMSKKCTGDQVSLGITLGKYCRMCSRKQVTTKMTAIERKQTCRTSAMGCAICQEPICKECWKEGYDKHN
jgi:hypothetical protein